MRVPTLQAAVEFSITRLHSRQQLPCTDRRKFPTALGLCPALVSALSLIGSMLIMCHCWLQLPAFSRRGDASPCSELRAAPSASDRLVRRARRRYVYLYLVLSIHAQQG